MTKGTDTLYFTYDAFGTPWTVKWNGTGYTYMTNLQGDVIAIVNTSNVAVVEYAYDAWGNVLSISGTMATTLGTLNPLTYRGYVYDYETQLYYLQSRYYNPEWGRFLNADDTGYLGADGTLTGYNMFAYCANNPVIRTDPTGCWSWKDIFNVATVVAVAAVVVAAVVLSGGSAAPPLLAAASTVVGTTVSASTVATAAIGIAIVSTTVMGTAATATILESNSGNKRSTPTSQNQMQKQVEKGQAPREVDRVDKPHVNAPKQQNHIHFKDGSAINMDGSLSHESRGVPIITNAILKWILDNGWKVAEEFLGG